jgi:hypothetical protein
MKFATLLLAALIAFAQEQAKDAHHAAVDARGDHAMGFSHERPFHRAILVSITK